MYRAADAIIAALSVHKRKRGERCPRQRGAQLRVGGDPADDGDAVGSGRLDALDERAHDRALVARGEIGAAGLDLAGERSRTL